jgi:transcriptional regulator of arginine metabolism
MYIHTRIMKVYTSRQRKAALREIIGRQGIGDQHHLQMELARRGIDTTQATVSRDLRDMGYVKIRLESGAYRYELLDRNPRGALQSRLRIMFKNFVTDVCGSGNLVLVKTAPGNANGVASLIDGLKHPRILGTVSGDDTIIVVVVGPRDRAGVEREFRELLG